MPANHKVRSWARREVDAFLQILALASFSVAQPVLDVMGKSPETLIFRGAGRAEIVIFALFVVLAPAIILWTLAAATGALGPRARVVTHRIIVWGLVSLFTLQVLKKATSLSTAPLVLSAAIIGAVSTGAVVRTRLMRDWLRWATVAAPAFLLVFLLISPVSRLVLPVRAGAVAERADRTPVVMVVLDEFPLLSLIDIQGGIDAEFFPNFADLAEHSTWYRNYTTVERNTLYAIPTMLTGQRQGDRSKVAVAADHPDNLFSLLSGSHRLQVYESLTQLCSIDACTAPGPEGRSGLSATQEAERAGGVPALVQDAATLWLDVTVPWRTAGEDTAQFADVVGPRTPETPAEESPESTPKEAAGPLLGVPALEDFLASLKKPTDPTLYYLHLMLPHHPWRFFPSGVEYTTPGGVTELPLAGTWLNEQWPLDLTRQRLLLQVQYVDSLLGRIVSEMRRVGLYERALFIVTSDHGISVHAGRPHRLTATDSNLHEVLWVPMFVKYPHQRQGEEDERNTDATDILPTIADVLDIDIPWSTDGHSMLGPDQRGRVKTVNFYPENENPVRHRIGLQEAWARMRREVFRPIVASEEPRLRPYLVGPGASLIGKRLDELPFGSPSGVQVALELPLGLRDVDPAKGSLPAFVWGRLLGAPANMQELVVVALNGRVAGVSATWKHTDGEPGRFAALIPEWFFRSGRNNLDLFLLDDGQVRPVALVSP